ncbi:MAG: pyridoxal phosphate-dependent aminotransferase [Planctomycetota bacterium]|nr:pyridoxal phosphate-dependent aminotransferase [Planctomycetota bacterium]
MKLSERISSVGASATIAVTMRAKQLLAEGLDVVSFGAGEPDFDTPGFIKDAAKAALDAGDTKYAPGTGKALVRAIAEKLKRENRLTYSPEQIVVTFGGKHALYAAFQVLLNPGRKVLIPAPYWVSYPEMVKLAGGQPIILPTRRRENFKITPQQVLDAAGEAEILVINSPSNPTGVTYTPDELAAIAEAVLKTDLIVFSDEIYEKLIYGDAKFVSFAALDERLVERTVTFNGLAKTFAMTGWRMGWAAGPKDVIGAIRRLMSHQTTNPVSFAQAGALAAYTSPQAAETIETMRREFEKRGRHMTERLNAIDGVQCVQPTGAFYCFPDVSAHYGRTLGGVEVVDSLSFAKAALEASKVALVPGVAFGQDKCVRLCFATGMEQIDKGLDRIKDLLES